MLNFATQTAKQKPRSGVMRGGMQRHNRKRLSAPDLDIQEFSQNFVWSQEAEQR